VDSVVVGDQDAHRSVCWPSNCREHRQVKIALVHNPTAGDGQDIDDVVKLLTDAGHEVRHRSSKADWKKLLQDPGDLVVAAGGDGTVRKVALAAADRGLVFAALPIGTANNIAKTLGILGDARDLVRSWEDGATVPIDIGEVEAPGASRRFVEGLGGGWIPELIARSEQVDDEFRLLGRETDRAMHLLADLLRGTEASGWRITADGIDLSGSYLAVEILNIRFVGPNVPLAPAGDPSDGLLDVVLVTDADRDGILEYLDQRLNLASGVMPPLRTARARVIDLAVPAGTRLHVDDREWPPGRDLDEPIELTVRCLPGAVGLRASA
jgi:diacylglycerol kinase family enzyme